MSSERMVEVRDITFAYGSEAPVFENFSWTVGSGEPWAVIGPSGCGKSTLIYLLAGLQKPQTGSIIVGGEPVTRPRPKTGVILQDYGLLPWATVRENASLGLKIRRFYGPDGTHAPADVRVSMEEVDYWLKRLGIFDVRDHYPAEISGGQRQRTAIVRTLVMHPDLLLMDEPFSSLDALTRESLQDLMLGLHRETGITTILVTHSIEEAALMGKKILVLGQPPNSKAVIVDNPNSGDRKYREDEEFMFTCNRLRDLLGKEPARR